MSLSESTTGTLIYCFKIGIHFIIILYYGKEIPAHMCMKV